MARTIRKTNSTSNAKRTGKAKAKTKSNTPIPAKSVSKAKAAKKTSPKKKNLPSQPKLSTTADPKKKSTPALNGKKKKSAAAANPFNKKMNRQEAIQSPHESKPTPKSGISKARQEASPKAPAESKSSPKKSLNGRAVTSESKVKATPKKNESKPKATPKAGPKGTEPDFVSDLTVSMGNAKGTGPRRILRAKNFPEIPTSQSYGYTEGTPEIPSGYGIDKLVVMPKDPEWLFTYWELTPHRIETGAQNRRPNLQYQEALKLSWEPAGLFEANYVFLPVEFEARKWYLGVPGDVPRSYKLELGWLDDEGHFISLLQSEPTANAENWSFTRARLSNTGGITAYTARRTVTLGASEVAVIEESRGLNLLENLSSGLFSSSSMALARKDVAASYESIVPTDYAKIEIAGTLRPGSQVRIGEKTYLPDGKGRFQAAVQADGDTLHLEVITPEGQARFFAYDLSTPSP